MVTKIQSESPVTKQIVTHYSRNPLRRKNFFTELLEGKWLVTVNTVVKVQ